MIQLVAVYCVLLRAAKRVGVVGVGVDVDRGWVKGFPSIRFVSFRLSDASSRGIWQIGVQAMMQQCPVVGSMGGGVAVRFTIPGKEERILETEMQAGRAAETIGGHSMQAVRGGLSTRHNSRATI